MLLQLISCNVTDGWYELTSGVFMVIKQSGSRKKSPYHKKNNADFAVLNLHTIINCV